MVTNKGKLDEIIKENIAPAMKNIGFKRKNRWFISEGPSYDKYLWIMTNRFPTRGNMDFTLDLYVMNRGGIPTKDMEVANKRLGQLKEIERDYWYEISSKTNAEKLGRKVGQDIAEYILPFFDEYNKVGKNG